MHIFGIVQLIIICTACRSRYFVAPLEPSPYAAVQMIVHSHSRDVMEGLTHRHECCKLCSPISLSSLLLQSLALRSHAIFFKKLRLAAEQFSQHLS